MQVISERLGRRTDFCMGDGMTHQEAVFLYYSASVSVVESLFSL